ncbi:ECF transporter S component [Levilactobacillus yonginensis]
MENSRSGLSVRAMVEMALFAGISYVLMFVALPIVPIVPYMKLDLSDLVVLIGMSVFGLGGAILIAAVKELLYFVTTGMDVVNLIGVMTAFIADLSLIVPISLVLKRRNPSLTRQIVAVVLGTLSLTVVLSLGNWLVITPLYLKVLNISIGLPVSKLVLLGVIPFNLIKGVVLGILFILLIRRMAPWLAKHTTL